MDAQTLNSKASQETFISLLQLDPAPMETPPADKEKALPPLPEAEDQTEPPHASTSRSSTASSIGLSGTGHGAVYYLSRIQRYSSYTFTVFACLHITTTSIIPLVTRSVAASESYLLLAREVYQTPLSEPLLVGLPLAAHVASGVALRLLRRSHNLRRYGGATPAVTAAKDHHAHHAHARPRHVWPPLSYISAAGYALAVFTQAHIFMNRALPLIAEGDSANIGLAYIGHGFARHGLISTVAYVGLLALGCGHMVWGWATWLGVAQSAGWQPAHLTGNSEVDKRVRQRRRRLWLTLHGIAVGTATLWAAGGLGIVARSGLTKGWVGNVYDGLYARVGL